MTLPQACDQGLYLLIQPLSSPEGSAQQRAAALLALLGDHPDNRSYLDKLTASPERILHQRLSALECLGVLLRRHWPSALGQLRLYRSEHGRPYLRAEDPHLSVPDFSLSHTAHYAGCALLVGGGQVGLDIEDVMGEDRGIALGERYFSAGEKQLLGASSHKDTAATRIWTAKEAMSKQQGEGYPLRFDSSACPAALSLHYFDISTDALCTVCVPAHTPLLSFQFPR